MVLPRVRVMASATLMLLPAHRVMSPRVVVIAATMFRIRSRPALIRTLPLVVVIGAATLASRPQQITKLPLVAVTAAFTFTSRAASRVKVVVLGAAVQVTAWSTLMSPLPGVVEVKLCVGGVPRAEPLAAPGRVLMTTLLVTSRAESVAPEMFWPAAMVKSTGSIDQTCRSRPWARRSRSGRRGRC